MRVVAAWGEWRAVISEMEFAFGVGKCVNVKTVGIEICRQIIGRKEKDGGSVTRFVANFQQALDHFQWSKTPYRVSVCCHSFCSAFLSVGWWNAPLKCSPRSYLTSL